MNSTILSPAKVNLLLKVVSRRSDGYHNLVSIVDIISIYDLIEFEDISDDKVVIIDRSGALPDGPENTMFRAATLLKESFRVRQGIRIVVHKNIPMGAGLGGGSSNAASVMKELVRRWRLPVEQSELTSMGRKIGADVPLFLYGKPCIMKGIGDRVDPIELPRIDYLIVYPNVLLSTKEVYQGLRIVLTRNENEVTFSGHFPAASDIAEVLENDLEVVAFDKCPVIKTIKERLIEAGAVGALMSGSGSAVFGIFRSQQGAIAASKQLESLGEVFVARST
jgi:4-diphosphocytidyl-2-C-methyl-D-erythritol kinase